MNKKWKARWCSLLLVLSMLVGLCIPAYAASEGGTGTSTGEENTESAGDTGEMIWRNNFDTETTDTAEAAKWDGGKAPNDFNLGSFNPAKGEMKIELDNTQFHSSPYSVHVTGDGAGRERSSLQPPAPLTAPQCLG